MGAAKSSRIAFKTGGKIPKELSASRISEYQEPIVTVYSRRGPIMVLNGNRMVIFALDKVHYSAPNLAFD